MACILHLRLHKSQPSNEARGILGPCIAGPKKCLAETMLLRCLSRKGNRAENRGMEWVVSPLSRRKSHYQSCGCEKRNESILY
jgi:hypothetical protein